MHAIRIITAGLTTIGFCMAQTTVTTTTTQVERMDRMPIYRVNVVSRTAKAINYRHRSGSTKVDFQGTALMPRAKGDARVDSKQGYLEVDAHMKDMDPPSRFGPEYLTFVLWAITPEGRPKNLGEVVLYGTTDSKLHVTTEL